MINLGLVHVDALVDISSIGGLDGVASSDGAVRMGALTRHRTLETVRTVADALPVLAEAVQHVGNRRVRSQGTLGGSLAHNDPSAEIPLVLSVLGAECEVSSGRESRRLPVDDFLVTYFTTALQEDEILVSVTIPRPEPPWGWGFREYAVRAGDFAIVAVAALVICQDGVIEEARIGAAGAGDKVHRLPTVEREARGLPIDGLDRLADAVQADIDPLDDPLVSVSYRRHLAGVLVARAMEDACRRSGWSYA
jgi:carbon-monoxide dehydrogenase medium subunit